jgi:LPS export ABC transporter protein LptC
VIARRCGATIVVAVVALGGCTSKTGGGTSGAPTPTAAPTATPIAFKVTSNRIGKRYVTLTEQKRGRTVYVLRADANEADRFAAGTGRSTFTRPHVVFYQARGKTLTADSPVATVEEQTKTVVMTGGVHARTNDGITLTCDTLRYDDRTEHIHGTGNVVVTTPRGERLQGDTLDADVQLDHVRVTGASSP